MYSGFWCTASIQGQGNLCVSKVGWMNAGCIPGQCHTSRHGEGTAACPRAHVFLPNASFPSPQLAAPSPYAFGSTPCPDK